MKTPGNSRRLWIVGTVLLLICCARAQTPRSQQHAIVSALQKREFNTALELLKPALREAPGNTQLLNMQAAAYAGLGRKQEAQALFRRVLRTAPDDIFALHGAIQIEYDAGNPAAIPLLKRLLRLQPEDTTSHGMLAVLLYQQSEWADAATHFEKAGGLLESQPEAKRAYIVCLVNLKKLDQVAGVLQAALAARPADKQQRQVLASVQLMAKHPQAAITTLEPLIAAAEPNLQTLELAALAYEDAHQTDKAVDALQRAILRYPSDVDLYLNFASIASVHQAFQLGLNVVNEGLQQQPRAPQLYLARGMLYAQTAKYDLAESDFKQAYELDPSQSLSVAAQGLAAINGNNLEGARSAVQEKLKAKPNDPVLLYLQADVLARKDLDPTSSDYQLALRSAKKAVALRPDLAPAHAVLAKLHMLTDNYGDAAEQCRKALAIDPKDQTSVYRLIQALRKSSGSDPEIPVLLKRLASIRQELLKEDREHFRYRLVEGDPDIQNKPQSR